MVSHEAVPNRNEAFLLPRGEGQDEGAIEVSRHVCGRPRQPRLHASSLVRRTRVSFVKRLLAKLIDYFKGSPGRRQYFDEDLDREQFDLLEAAAQLQVTEFKLFELAYRDWYGHPPKHQVIEVYFRNYMFNRIIPVWVSHFARVIVEKSQAGTLDPRDYGIYQRLPSRRMQRIGQAYTAMLLVAFVILMYMAYGDALVPETVQSLFGRGDTAGLPQHNTMP